MEKTSKKKYLPFVYIPLGIIGVFLVWEILSLTLKTPLFPGVEKIIPLFFSLFGQGSTYEAIGGTILRLVISLALSSLIGMLFGVLGGIFERFRLFFRPFVTFLRTIPTAAVIFIDNTIGTINALLISKAVLGVIKILVLLLLAFWKDLGKKRTYILFVVLLLLDIGIGGLLILNMLNKGFDFSFVGVVTALIVDVTVGLAIHGKYADKAERGSN